jgi:hypothetical protein
MGHPIRASLPGGAVRPSGVGIRNCELHLVRKLAWLRALTLSARDKHTRRNKAWLIQCFYGRHNASL